MMGEFRSICYIRLFILPSIVLSQRLYTLIYLLDFSQYLLMPLTPPSPKKYWGQHFLHDQSISERIVQCLDKSEGLDAIIEVGPGRGALTQWLIAGKKKPLYLIEVDPSMVHYLAERYPDLKERLIHADFLQFPFEKLPHDQIAVIGNFPYNIASQILLHSVDYRHQVKEIVCMLQREVAQRISSPPGSKRYGLLSVWLQAFYTISYVLEVPPEAFTPPPKIFSAVLHMKRYRTELPCDEKYFFRIVKIAFQQRRKMLSNALRPLGKPLDLIPELIRSKRAEQLSVDDFIAITQLLSNI